MHGGIITSAKNFTQAIDEAGVPCFVSLCPKKSDEHAETIRGCPMPSGRWGHDSAPPAAVRAEPIHVRWQQSLPHFEMTWATRPGAEGNDHRTRQPGDVFAIANYTKIREPDKPEARTVTADAVASGRKVDASDQESNCRSPEDVSSALLIALDGSNKLRRTGLEPVTFGSVDRCSIHLS